MFHTLGVLWSSAKPILGILVGDFFVCLGGFCFGSLGGKGRERVVGFWFGFLFFLGGLFVLEWFLLLLLLFPFWFFVCFVDFSWFLGCLFFLCFLIFLCWLWGVFWSGIGGIFLIFLDTAQQPVSLKTANLRDHSYFS